MARSVIGHSRDSDGDRHDSKFDIGEVPDIMRVEGQLCDACERYRKAGN